MLETRSKHPTESVTERVNRIVDKAEARVSKFMIERSRAVALQSAKPGRIKGTEKHKKTASK